MPRADTDDKSASLPQNVARPRHGAVAPVWASWTRSDQGKPRARVSRPSPSTLSSCRLWRVTQHEPWLSLGSGLVLLHRTVPYPLVVSSIRGWLSAFPKRGEARGLMSVHPYIWDMAFMKPEISVLRSRASRPGIDFKARLDQCRPKRHQLNIGHFHLQRNFEHIYSLGPQTTARKGPRRSPGTLGSPLYLQF